MEPVNNQTGEILITDQSATIGKIALALAKAQGQIEGASKDSENPHFKSKYADLASVWEACRAPLSANEIAVVQIPSGGLGGVRIITKLIHSSGEWMSGELTLKPAREDPQGIGSAITYGRRYCLAAMVGVAPEDDDGEAASGRGQATSKAPTNDKQASNDKAASQARTAAPQNNADAEWKKDAERIKKEVINSATLDSLNGFVKAETPTLQTIKSHSDTAYAHLMKCITQRTSDLSQAA